jgi:ribosomal protein L31E
MRVADALAEGIEAYELRRKSCHHPYWGVVRPAIQGPDPPMTRILDAAAVVRGGGALGGWASARRQGVVLLDGLDRLGRERPVLLHTLPGHQVRRRPGIEPTRVRLLPGEIEWYDGDAVTILERALYDEMRLAPNLTEAVVVLDMGVSRVTGHARTTIEAVRQLIQRHVKTRGIVQARDALEWASQRSCSPLESRTRVVAREFLPSVAWRVNRPVFDLRGRLLGIADLIDPASGLVIESDGRQHREDELLHTADNVREEGMEDANLTVVRVTGRDHRDPVALGARLRRGYRRARARDSRRDAWTLVEPGWWPRSRLASRWGTSQQR